MYGGYVNISANNNIQYSAITSVFDPFPLSFPPSLENDMTCQQGKCNFATLSAANEDRQKNTVMKMVMTKEEEKT